MLRCWQDRLAYDESKCLAALTKQRLVTGQGRRSHGNDFLNSCRTCSIKHYNRRRFLLHLSLCVCFLTEARVYSSLLLVGAPALESKNSCNQAGHGVDQFVAVEGLILGPVGPVERVSFAVADGYPSKRRGAVPDLF